MGTSDHHIPDLGVPALEAKAGTIQRLARRHWRASAKLEYSEIFLPPVPQDWCQKNGKVKKLLQHRRTGGAS